LRPLFILLVACGGPTHVDPPVAHVATDAAVDAPAPNLFDAGVSDAVANAKAWVFRYHTAQRTETWTLRYSGDQALLIVESAQGALRYLGSATDGATLALAVSTSSAKIALDCKHTTRAVSAKCNDTKAKPIDVLDCYHPDFKEPMPFGHEPGIEYAVDASCNGYRLIVP
jgi:hypothetical protein